jgi:methylenetetrahydrofolate--tRNA-(uracil-5-)-methyltransferase
MTEIPSDLPVIIASGPLTSDALSRAVSQLTGEENLFFFDAIAPVIALDSINMEIAFRASRYDREETGDGDYINCPFSKEEYETFVDTLLSGERIVLKSFEAALQSDTNKNGKYFFEGCLPVEILAARGKDALAFGPLRPVGLRDPRTGKRPWAALQLRQDNLAGDQYNMVGFQTNLKYSEQQRIFRTIPGLENAVFERYGQMHRNSYIAAPGLLNSKLQMIQHPNVFFAGQLAGVEGYMGNIGTGLIAGLNAASWIQGIDFPEIPSETMIGSMLYYLSHANKESFQPVKANFGIMPPLKEPARSKQERAKQYASRSLSALQQCRMTNSQSSTF